MVDVSVLLPFRNAASTLESALRSVLVERSVRLEVLAIDDGSTDGSATIAARLNDPRLRVVPACGRGLVAALETGRRQARGEFLARMDADDVSLPGRLLAQHQDLARRPSVAALGTRVAVVGGGEGLRRYVAWQNGLCSEEEHRREIFVEAPLCHPSVMLRASAVESVGGYRTGDFPEDYDLWLRLDAAGWGLAKLPRVLLRWHHGPARATFNDPRYRVEAFRALKAPFVAQRLAGEERSIATWGAGRTGRRTMRLLERYGLRACLWIDIDPAKIGRTARGAPIVAMDRLHPRLHFVLVAVGARGARPLIRAALVERGFREGADFLCVS